MQEIAIDEKYSEFEAYLKSSPRIIFSAPFGDGKTYFLQKFAEKHEDDCFIVRLRPVNYSVSNNKDVFEYIKRDIVFRLYEAKQLENINFNAIFSKELVKENIDNLTTFLLSFLPKGELLKKAINFAKTIHKEYKSRKLVFQEYNKQFEIQRGGLYEHDAYTAFICAVLEKIQKRKVLIIDDLDRMDPAHLFRILNVVSAHIDDESVTKSNKFGFDNIVAVMDYNTAKNIFRHFYGEKADYEGYMSKFLSSRPFYYSITEIARKELLKKIQQMLGKSISVGNFQILNQKISSASLRDCKKCLDIDAASKTRQDEFEIRIKFSAKFPLFQLLLYMHEIGMELEDVANDLSSLNWSETKNNAPIANLQFLAPLIISETKYKYYKIAGDDHAFVFRSKSSEKPVTKIDELDLQQLLINDKSILLALDTESVKKLIAGNLNKLNSVLLIGERNGQQ